MSSSTGNVSLSPDDESGSWTDTVAGAANRFNQEACSVGCGYKPARRTAIRIDKFLPHSDLTSGWTIAGQGREVWQEFAAQGFPALGWPGGPHASHQMTATLLALIEDS